MFFFFSCSRDHRYLHVLTLSFPTRRSSERRAPMVMESTRRSSSMCPVASDMGRSLAPRGGGREDVGETHRRAELGWQVRSEEHTSELQSLMRNSYAVFCLKKKKQSDTIIQSSHM